MRDLQILVQFVRRWFGYHLKRLSLRIRARREASLARATAYEGMMNYPELRELYSLAKAASPDGVIVEVGSYRGASTIALAQGSLDGPQIPVFAIDPHDFVSMTGYQYAMHDSAAFMQHMLIAGVAHLVRPVTLFSYEVYDGWRRPISLLWLDGDHTYEGVKQDFERFSPHLLPQAPIAFHDAKAKKFGVHQLIAELLASGDYEQVSDVRRIIVLRKLT